jgi:hypothetical protein
MMFDWFGSASLPLLEKLPPIGRARGYRLYALCGQRFVDLWQYGGRALLGHTPSGLLKTLKNAASRGLFVPLPHPARLRLEKALEKLFPGCSFRIYRDRAALFDALKSPGLVLPDAATAGAAQAVPPTGQGPALWRPFWDEGAPLAFEDAPPVFVPALPLPWMNAPELLVLKGTAEGGPEGQEDTKALGLADENFVSPLFLSGLARAVYDLIASAQSRLPLNLKKYRQGFPLWKRRGIYLLFDGEAGLYKSLFARFLERGFLFPPDPALPAILPPGLSPGEEAALISVLSFTP